MGLEPADDVDDAGRAQRVERVAATERDRAATCALACDLHAQVLALAHRLDRVERRRGHEDARRGIADAVRLEPRELLRQGERQLANAGDRVDVHALLEIGVGEHGVDVALEGVGERRDLVCRDRQPRRRAVPSEALEHGRARREARVQVERRDRATRARSLIAVERDHDHRAAVALDEPGRDDADHARVPPLAGDDVAASLAALGRTSLDRGDGRAQDVGLDRLALAVPLLETPRERLGLCAVAREQEVERLARMAEPAGGVDPRAEAEPEVGGAQARTIDAGHLHQRRQPGSLAACEATQAGAHERAVLVAQLDHVGDRREGDEIEAALQLDGRLGRAEPARPQRLRELEHDPRPAQLAERVGVLVRAARAHQGRLGQHGPRPVVVADRRPRVPGRARGRPHRQPRARSRRTGRAPAPWSASRSIVSIATP